ncbi:hypothetical protein Q8G35_25050 [Peribacillus simplex]|uniref:Uncharacterized protein n=2 Tax=Peribacillus TaxID=2675229 RepID=A0AA90PLA0_9BACI|nr:MULTISPECIES: hypothetical protein [Peribacillus]MDP1421549.1 hypothetical protein [Peribacillus simplex]MDP1454300.1 hypothetical protein [Peribacillus frigoritolerans]
MMEVSLYPALKDVGQVDRRCNKKEMWRSNSLQMPDCDAQDVLAQVLSQDVENLTCVPLVVIIGKSPMMEVSL